MRYGGGAAYVDVAEFCYLYMLDFFAITAATVALLPCC